MEKVIVCLQLGIVVSERIFISGHIGPGHVISVSDFSRQLWTLRRRAVAFGRPKSPVIVLPAQAGIRTVRAGPSTSSGCADLSRRAGDFPDSGFLRNDGSGAGIKGDNPRRRVPNVIALASPFLQLLTLRFRQYQRNHRHRRLIRPSALPACCRCFPPPATSSPTPPTAIAPPL